MKKLSEDEKPQLTVNNATCLNDMANILKFSETSKMIREPSQIRFAFFGILPRTYPPYFAIFM
jgi:hypothetical protein